MWFVEKSSSYGLKFFACLNDERHDIGLPIANKNNSFYDS